MSSLSLASNQFTGKLPTLDDYRNLIKNAKVLDGDIIIRNNQLNKVNYGSGAANIFTFGLSDRRVRGTAEENFESRVKFWMALKNAAGSVLTEGDLDAIGKSLGLKIGKDGDQYTFTENEAANEKGSDALARRTIAHFIEIFDAKKSPVKSDPGKTYIGGGYGLNLTEKQFKGIFDQLVDRDLAKVKLDEVLAAKGMATEANRVLYGKILNTLLQECQHRFAVGVSDGLFEKVFSDGLGIDAIATKVAKLAVDLDASFVPGSSTVGSLGKSNVLSEDARRRIDKYSKEFERLGVAAMSDVTKLGDGFMTQAKNVTTDKSALMAADLLFNSDTTEVDKLGFSDGRRIANILMKDLGTFQSLCTAVKGNQTHPVFERLSELDTKVADAFRNLISTVNAKCFGEGIPQEPGDFKKQCVAEFGTLLKVTSGSAGKTLESVIDKAASDFIWKSTGGSDEDIDNIKLVTSMNGHSPLMARLGLAIGLYNENDWGVADEYGSLAAVMSAHLDKSVQPLDLRRMLAAGFRFSGKTDNAGGVSFDESRIIMEMGPIALKLLQSVGDTGNMSMNTALENVRGNLRRIDAGMVKAQLVEHLKKSFDQDELAKIKGITINNSLGAASIAETFSATINYIDENTKPVDLVVKLVRPDVKTKFEGETKAYLDKFGKNVEALGQLLAEAKSPDQDQNAILDRYTTYLNAQGKKGQIQQLQGNPEDLLTFIQEELAKQKSAYTELLSLQGSVSKEFDFTKEEFTALKSYAAFLGKPNDKSNVKSMELVLKDPGKKAEFDNALRTLMEIQAKKDAGDATYKDFDYDKALRELAFGKKGEGGENFVGGYLIKSSESCLFCKKVDNAMPVDKFVSSDKTDLKSLAQLRHNLLELAQKSVDNLLNGHPPVIHLDMHASNIMTDGKSITLIDHGKEFAVSPKEQQNYSTLLKIMSGSVTAPGKELHNAYVSFLELEKGKSNTIEVTNAIDDALREYGRGKDKDRDFVRNVVGVGDELTIKAMLGQTDNVEGEGTGNQGIGLMVGMIQNLQKNNAFVPSTLGAFAHTFQKLDSTIKIVGKKLEQSAQDEEAEYCKGLITRFENSCKKAVAEAEEKTKNSEDSDQKGYAKNYLTLKSELEEKFTELKGKGVKYDIMADGALKVRESIGLLIDNAFRAASLSKWANNSDVFGDDLRETLHKSLNELFNNEEALKGAIAKSGPNSSSGHTDAYENILNTATLTFGQGEFKVNCTTVDDVFRCMTAQLN